MLLLLPQGRHRVLCRPLASQPSPALCTRPRLKRAELPHLVVKLEELIAAVARQVEQHVGVGAGAQAFGGRGAGGVVAWQAGRQAGGGKQMRCAAAYGASSQHSAGPR